MRRGGGGRGAAASPLACLLAALLLAGGGLALLGRASAEEPIPAAAAALRAAQRMELAEAVLKKAILAEGIPIEEELDPNRTGLVGPEWSPLTTTLGSLEAKRSVLNPNFAALMVRYFDEAGLEAGDAVALGASGSFPGLALAALCAARELGLEATTIASFGSSMYGATRPELTLPRMLRILAAAGVLPDSLAAVSPGGDADHGESALYDDARAVIARLAAESGVEFIDFDPPDLAASVARRMEIYRERAGARGAACFVNIGGASPNSGESPYTLAFPQGLVLDPPPIPGGAERGLVYEFAARGIPVVNLLNVRLLAERAGLPYDPVPLPRAGEGGVYRRSRPSRPIAAAALAASLAPLAAAGAARARRIRRERGERSAAR